MTDSPPQEPKIWQPLHPAIRPKLDPQYVAWHDKYLQFIEPEELSPWSRAKKTAVALPPGGTVPVAVGSIREHDVGRFRVRVYTPTTITTTTIAEAGEQQEDDGHAWPVLVWFHGGGWVNGNLNSGTDYCSMFCQDARCVVVSVDYGLAPENPYPVAVEDAIDSVRWVYSSPPELGTIDTRRVSIGGASSGANLAIVASIAAVNPSAVFPSAKPSFPIPPSHPPPVSLFAFIPVVDNTATADDVWKSTAETAPWLTAGRLVLYRDLYLSRKGDHEKWDASPNKAPDSLLRNLPKTWVAVAEFDLLAPEALAFTEQLKHLGVDAESLVVPGATHAIMSLHGRIDRGLQLLKDGVKHLQSVFAT